MRIKTQQNLVVLGFAQQIQAVSQRTKQIATTILKITGIFAWVFMAYGLQAQSLSTDDFSGTYCLEASFNVNYTASGDFGSNTFKAYVSRDNFVTSVEIGSKSVSGTQSNGSISVTIPGNLSSANNYRIRVVSTSAPILGDSDDNGTNLTITALTITANNPSASIYCVGDPISVDFTTSCALSNGNTFTLQLSDKTGSFASPTTVATKTGTTGSTITGNIPNVPYGSAYKVRVVSSNPNTNTTWTANTTAFKIGNAKLSNLKSVGSTFCPGEVMSLGYTFASNEELNPGNITSVQLSDASGSFASPTVLGSLGSTATSGTIYAIIPYVVTGGSGYRIRIVSSNTATVGCIEYGPYTITKVRDFTDPISSYVCAGGTLNLSTDAGFTSYAWQKVSAPPFSNINVGSTSTTSLAKNGSNVYIGTARGVYVSSDGGSTFSKNSQVIDTFINKIFVNGAKVYAATANGIYYSSDSGANFNTNFTSDNNGLPLQNVSAVATNADGTIIYAGTTSGLSRSTNSGTSFAAVSIGQSVSDTITVSGIFVSGSTVYLSTGAGLKISYDDGATFPVSIGSGTGLLPSANATSVFVKDGIIYVGTDSGLSVSTNGGGSWTNYNAINNGLAGDMVNAIAVANNLIYLCTNNGLSVGNLGGDGFSIISISQTFTNINGIVAEATSSTVNSLYLVIVGGGFVTNTFTLSDLGVSTSSYAQSVVSSDSGSSFQVKVEKNGCFLTSNQAHIADIPPDFSSVTSVAPTQCGGVSGRIILSGLAPNAQYQLFYTGPSQGIPKSGDTVTITAQGTDTIFLLGPGTYTNIYMKSLVKRTGQTDGCTNTAASIVISDGVQPTAVTANTLSPICSGQNLSISLTSTLAANEVYRWYTDAGGTILASPDITTGSTFTLTNLPTSSGTLYVRKRNNNTLCNGNLLAINYTVSQAVQISSSVASQPSSATATDGSLIIAITSSSNPSGAYTLSYNKVVNSVSTPQTVSGLTLASFPYTLNNLSVGNYTNITVTASNGCPSNVIASTALVGLPSPTAIGGATLQSQNCGITGVDGGYFQKVELPYAASSNWITENAGAIAVGRIRQSIYNSAAKNETIEMRGYVKFDLSSIPTNATIDKVELRPRSLFGGFQTVGDVNISYAVGDLKFDVTQVSATNYSPYVGYSDQVFDDLFDPKYNDFVIGANATGALTDLGAQAVNDVQLRLANDKKFELGIALSGTDTILPLTLFNGIVFAPSSYQKLCITYHLNDYGDLPEPKYATNAEGGLVGPSHRVDLLDVNPDVNTTLLRPALYIGATAPDAEADGQVNDNASGTADEDLTTASFSGKLIAGESVTLTVPVTNNIPQPAKLSVFIDWNGDGIFNNTSERYDQDVLPATQVSASSTPIPYTNSFAFNLTVPKLDNSYAVGVRVRLSTGTGLDAYGPAPNGEVEDFLMDVLGLDYGDLPDPTAGLGIDNYQTRRADNGARHAVPTTLLVFLGNTVDTETDAVPSALADGDDKNNINNNDEDGIRFLTSPMVPGQPVTIEYTATNNSSTAAKLYLYADFNNDGVNSMEDAPVMFTSGNAVVAANAGQVTGQLTFLLPQNAEYGGDKAMFRFRFTTDVDPLPYGLAQNGEIEDYLSSDILLNDWADLPEPKYITDASGGIVGPSHRIHYLDSDSGSGQNYLNTLYIGATPPDSENDGRPTHLANGDNNSYQADEDLSSLNFLNPTTNQPFPLVADEPIRLRIPVVNNSPDNPATLWAFMDWNGDGDFEDEGEKMSQTVATNYNGNIDFNFTIPKVVKSDTIGIRIRLTSGAIIDAYGPAPDGEVEDFVVEIRTIDYGDLPDATAGLGIDNYQTRHADNGARHALPVVPLVYLGNTVDTETDAVPSALADGDDKNNINSDDEDGIRFLTSPMVPGQTVTIKYTATNNSSAAAKLYLYADFNNDGVNSIENVPVVFTSGNAVVAANAGTVTRQLTFTLPQNAEYGRDKAMFRFRFTTDVDPLPYGLAQDGEIEDYLSSDILLNDWA
ncbi:GEVED domain-containing protein, partial [Haliscomenobacter sp.]|uniref:GEVED domain-containing protein n=1 Tax=Haliscomenobacter sp. TaxID=2717303 RepID=UPI003364C2CC